MTYQIPGRTTKECGSRVSKMTERSGESRLSSEKQEIVLVGQIEVCCRGQVIKASHSFVVE